jgi:4-diphosphocytidyl-2-C-methyl-D-erythritol kinase
VSKGHTQTTVFAPAKINLFLHVGDKRADGYHNICSLAAFADVGDVIGAAPSDTLTLTTTGAFAGALAGDDDDNLVLRAARTLQDWAKAADRRADGARLTLQKDLPVASGIGGGSTDAAATLKLLNGLWQLHAGAGDLARIGANLGADVPVCLLAGAALMEGIGDRLTPLADLPRLPAILVNPRISVMTADVFRALDRRTGVAAPQRATGRSPREFAAWLKASRNDLQEPASGIAPTILNAITEISATNGCLLARMSGSGATCFGLYETNVDAAAAASSVRARQPHWWVSSTELR